MIKVGGLDGARTAAGCGLVAKKQQWYLEVVFQDSRSYPVSGTLMHAGDKGADADQKVFLS